MDLAIHVSLANFMHPRKGGRVVPNVAARELQAPVPGGEFATRACAVPVVFPFIPKPTGEVKRKEVFFSTGGTPDVFKGQF